MLSPYVHAGMTVADVGCGMGYFTIALARLVNGGGKVLAVDLQARMLARVAKRAERAGLGSSIELRLCRDNDIGLDAGTIDFALAFWMAHETPDRQKFFRQLATAIKPQGRVLMVEPKLHVPPLLFRNEIHEAQTAGFHVRDYPAIALSRAVLLEKAGCSADTSHRNRTER